MDTSQLKCMIKCDCVLNRRIIGVFSADNLPRVLPQTPFGFIANTDIHTKSGQHWCAFFSDIRGHVDFFDTYGRTASGNSHHFRMWLDNKATTLHTNRIQIQSDTSALCGLYCILFLHQRLAGYTYQNFINAFDESALDTNDNYVADTMLKAYYQCVGNELEKNQTCTSLIKCS